MSFYHSHLYSPCKDENVKVIPPQKIKVYKVIPKTVPIYEEFVGQDWGFMPTEPISLRKEIQERKLEKKAQGKEERERRKQERQNREN